ncbi:uncharacterized protein LOC115970367 [Quercus lobata]|uniref:uncharacterized protein LOC115970367 n=1 Tax=Quercus lobata TaxID=97700 RepID=UPI001244D6C0|nr:uncharacterized protein LOC115970367 [Quercus lobata]
MTFKELVHRIVDRIKNEQYFRRPNKMGRDPSRRNRNMVLKDHLKQLVKAGYLKIFVVDPRNQDAEQGTQPQGNPLPPPLGVIEVIHTASRGTLVSKRRGVLTVVPIEGCLGEQPSEKMLKPTREPIAFNDDDLEGTIQAHDDALVVMARINGFIVKKVLIDQGSGAEVMYPDLFNGLGLKNEDFSKYDTPLVGFDGQMAILEG